MPSKNQNKLNYRVFGNGYPVVFLHGFLESNTMWEYLQFSGGYQQIQFDLPGHGDSFILEDSSLTMQSMALKVKMALDQLGVKRYHLVGHSMGGYVGLELMKNDSRCQKMILLNSNFWTDNKKKKGDRIRIAKIVETNKELFIYEAIPNLFLDPEKHDLSVKELINEALEIDSKAIALSSLAMGIRNDFSDFVRLNAERIKIIQGANDPVVSCDRMITFKSENNIELSIIEDCGHMGHIEKGEKVVKEIESFLCEF